MPDIFIIGCGDIGSLLAAKWRERNVTVTALARSEASKRRLQGLGLKTVFGDLDDPASLRDLPLTGTVLYYLAPPPPHGENDPRMHHLLEALANGQQPRRIVYISTSGVYGDTGGA